MFREREKREIKLAIEMITKGGKQKVALTRRERDSRRCRATQVVRRKQLRVLLDFSMEVGAENNKPQDRSKVLGGGQGIKEKKHVNRDTTSRTAANRQTEVSGLSVGKDYRGLRTSRSPFNML